MIWLNPYQRYGSLWIVIPFACLNIKNNQIINDGCSMNGFINGLFFNFGSSNDGCENCSTKFKHQSTITVHEVHENPFQSPSNHQKSMFHHFSWFLMIAWWFQFMETVHENDCNVPSMFHHQSSISNINHHFSTPLPVKKPGLFARFLRLVLVRPAVERRAELLAARGSFRKDSVPGGVLEWSCLVNCCYCMLLLIILLTIIN